MGSRGSRVGNRRIRLWIEVGLAVVSAALALLTLITREWIELFFGFDPDAGSGALEWAIVIALAVATVAFSLMARAELKRGRA